MIALSIFAPDPPTKMQEKVMAICEYAFTGCLGAVLGLLGGRAARPDFTAPWPGEGPDDKAIKDSGATHQGAITTVDSSYRV